MQEQHEGSLAEFGDVQADAVGRDVAVRPRTRDPHNGRVGFAAQLSSPLRVRAATVSFAAAIDFSGALIFLTLR